MNAIEEYAINLVADGAESLAEDDLDEDGAFPEGDQGDHDHDAACDLAVKIAHAIRDNPAAVLALVGR